MTFPQYAALQRALEEAAADVVKLSSENQKFRASMQSLESLVNIQCSPGNFDQDEYMCGIANGLLVAMSVFDGKEPEFKLPPAAKAEAQLVQLRELLNLKENRITDLVAQLAARPAVSAAVAEVIERYAENYDFMARTSKAADGWATCVAQDLRGNIGKEIAALLLQDKPDVALTRPKSCPIVGGCQSNADCICANIIPAAPTDKENLTVVSAPADQRAELPPLVAFDMDEYFNMHSGGVQLRERHDWHSLEAAIETYARAAVAADRAGRVVDDDWIEQEARQWWSAGGHMEAGHGADRINCFIAGAKHIRAILSASPAAPPAAVPALSNPWHNAVLAECMRIEAAYDSTDPVKTVAALIDWHVKQAQEVSATIKMQADNYVKMTCGTAAAPAQAVDALPQESRKVLQAFIDYCTEPAGMTLEIALHPVKFREFFDNLDKQRDALVIRAKELLDSKL